MAIKINLEKAYDRHRWDFIKYTLEDIRIPLNIVNLIWCCISSPTMRLLWNGEALDEFSSSRGIRQGNPISPYLFVLCLERLIHSIEAEVNSRTWLPIKLSIHFPPIYHLAFADDLLLFAEASVGKAEIIQAVLKSFCEPFGQRVSLEKTRIFFSDNVHHSHRVDIREKLGFQSTTDLGKYLGIPVLHKRMNKNTFQFTIDKVNSRLSTWKAQTLSFAGRVTLTKSVLQALPSYVMQSSIIPKGVCDDIDKIFRGFVWGEENGQRRLHLLSWDKIWLPKKEGGLRLRTMRDLNTTFMLKACWNLCTPIDHLWKSAVRDKYGVGHDGFPKFDSRKTVSNFWAGIKSNWDTFRSNLSWNLGNGETIRFW